MEVATHGLGIDLSIEPTTLDPIQLIVSDESGKGLNAFTMMHFGASPMAVFVHVNFGPWSRTISTYASESNRRHQPTFVALLSNIPGYHIGAKGESYAQERRSWVPRSDVQYCSTVIFSVSCRIQLGTCDRNTRACETSMSSRWQVI